MKTKITICVLLSIILILSGYIIQLYIQKPTSISVFKDCVPDEESAIGIAKIVCKAYTGADLENEAFVAVSGETEWQVHLKDESDFGANVISGNDGGIFINKHDSTIIKVLLNERDIERYFQLKAKYDKSNKH